MKKIICLDFDGVIHSYVSEWEDVSIIPDKPVEGAIDWIKSAIKKYNINIFSSRSKNLDGIIAMKLYLINHGMTHNEILKIEFPIDKPPAEIFIDDRGFHFKGKFPTDKYINNFKQWNK